MKTTVGLLPELAIEQASTLVEGPEFEVLESGRLSFDSEAEYYFTIDRLKRSAGKMLVTLSRGVSAPELGDIVDGPSGDSVTLIYSNGQLEAIKDRPVGYDAFLSPSDYLANIIPARRKVQ
ncbi:MAG: hypothetical protein ABSB12_02900, partial [Candidatus Saccharimonadales bacterium]